MAVTVCKITAVVRDQFRRLTVVERREMRDTIREKRGMVEEDLASYERELRDARELDRDGVDGAANYPCREGQLGSRGLAG